MFGTLGGPEIFLIVVVALIVFGPRKLPEIGRSIGQVLGELRRASNDFKRTIDDEIEADKRQQAPAPPAPAAPPLLAPPEGATISRGAAPGDGAPAPAEAAPPAEPPPAPPAPPAEPPR